MEERLEEGRETKIHKFFHKTSASSRTKKPKRREFSNKLKSIKFLHQQTHKKEVSLSLSFSFAASKNW
jgi:hypothetical protein